MISVSPLVIFKAGRREAHFKSREARNSKSSLSCERLLHLIMNIVDDRLAPQLGRESPSQRVSSLFPPARRM